MRLPGLSSLALLSTLGACATVGMMQGLPPDAGELALYAAPPDTLVAVVEQAIRQQDSRASTFSPALSLGVGLASW